jgi:hypothetical protein
VIWKEIADAEPNFAEFELYDAMLITAFAMLVMGLVTLRYVCLAKGSTCCKREWMAKRAFKHGVVSFIVFLMAYGASKHSCAKIMNITEVLQNNGTITGPTHPSHHEGRHLQEWGAKPDQHEGFFNEMKEEMNAMMNMNRTEFDREF